MNERIKELIEKSGVYIAYENKEVTDKELEFLVELVVRECEQVSLKNSHRDDDMGSIIAKQIKQHFGVVERKGWVCPKCGTDRTQEVCPKGYTAALTGECPMVGTAQ